MYSDLDKRVWRRAQQLFQPESMPGEQWGTLTSDGRFIEAFTEREGPSSPTPSMIEQSRRDAFIARAIAELRAEGENINEDGTKADP